MSIKKQKQFQKIGNFGKFLHIINSFVYFTLIYHKSQKKTIAYTIFNIPLITKINHYFITLLFQKNNYYFLPLFN